MVYGRPVITPLPGFLVATDLSRTRSRLGLLEMNITCGLFDRVLASQYNPLSALSRGVPATLSDTTNGEIPSWNFDSWATRA